MTPFDRKVRAQVYSLLVAGAADSDGVTVDSVALAGGWERSAVSASFNRLESDHRLALRDHGDSVWMAHPFSGVATPYRAEIGDTSWFANCAWDALAIISLLGDGRAHGPDGLVWNVSGGRVEPDGIVHFLVPARRFWDDIGFT